MKRLWILAALLLIGCGNNKSNADVGYHAPSDEPSVETTEDSAVTYDNPNTRTHSSYSLDVDKNPDGSVDRINFKNGGYIGENHIASQKDNGDGTITVTTDKGYDYTVEGSIEK